MNNQVDIDINIDGEMEKIPTTSSYIIPLTDNLTAAIDNDDDTGNKSTVIGLMMIDDTSSSSNEHITSNDNEPNNNNDNNTDSNNDHLIIAVTDDDINIDSSNPTRVNTASIPSRGGNMTASVDSANLQYLLEKQKMTKLQLAQTNLKSVKQFRLQNEKLHRELEIAYRKWKEIEVPLQDNVLTLLMFVM